MRGPFERVGSGLSVDDVTHRLELPTPLRAFYRLQYIDLGVNLIPQSSE